MAIKKPCRRRRAALLSFALCFAVAAGDGYTPAIVATVCGAAQAADPQGFDVSFVNTMEAINQQVSRSGFGAASSGNGSDVVSGIGQCYGYLSETDCQLCYAESRVKLPHCLPATDSRIYLQDCFLRYAGGGGNITGVGTDGADKSVCSNSTVPSSSSQQFVAAAKAAVGNVTAAAGLYIVGSVAVDAGSEGGGGETVYAMSQCWKSMNESACRSCAASAGQEALQCAPAVEGYGLNAGCVVRYSTQPFFSLATDQQSSSDSSNRKIIVAVLSVLTAVVVIGAAAVYLRWRRSRRHSEFNDEDDGSSEIIRTISASQLSFKYEDLRRASDDFSAANKLGQGGYGSVYKAVLPDGREVAVKRLFFHTRRWAEQFFNEVSLISQVQHKNLVKLLGCSVDGPESLLVYEYLCNTSLDNFLFDSFKKMELDWGRRREIIAGTAEGLSYLHGSSEIRIIHRDIKASNVLLDERFRPKIADFGLARGFADGQSHLSTGVAGTIGYMAPEYIVHGQLTEKADVYSYGVLVLEVLTGRKNHNSVAMSAEGWSLLSEIWSHFVSGTVTEMLDPGVGGQCSETEAARVFQIGLLCAQASPSLRPPMWKVVEMLHSTAPAALPKPTQPPFVDVKGSNPRRTGGGPSGLSSSSASDSSKSPFSANLLADVQSLPTTGNSLVRLS